MSDLRSGSVFKVRGYRTGDFAAIQHLWELTGMGSPLRGDNESTIEESLRIGGSFFILEEEKSGIIAGTSWLTYDGRRIMLHHFAVLPEFQGKGLSKVLLSASLKFVREKGCQVKLEVNRSNYKAISLYNKYGFTKLGDYDVYIIRDIHSIR